MLFIHEAAYVPMCVSLVSCDDECGGGDGDGDGGGGGGRLWY